MQHSEKKECRIYRANVQKAVELSPLLEAEPLEIQTMALTLLYQHDSYGFKKMAENARDCIFNLSVLLAKVDLPIEEREKILNQIEILQMQQDDYNWLSAYGPE